MKLALGGSLDNAVVLDDTKVLNNDGLRFSDEFVRMWEYYLCYCEGGFKERAIGTVHLIATKPLCKPRDLTCHI